MVKIKPGILYSSEFSFDDGTLFLTIITSTPVKTEDYNALGALCKQKKIIKTHDALVSHIIRYLNTKYKIIATMEI